MTLEEEFHKAISNSDIKTAKKLALESGLDFNHSLPPFDKTPLSNAASLGLTASVDFLLSLDVDINKTDGNDMTPLMNACSAGKVKGSKVALKLIESGANVNYVRSDDDMTALQFAVISCRPEVITALIEHGAELDGPENAEETALMLAARNNNVAVLEILINAGADHKLESKLSWAKGLTPLGIAKEAKHKKAVEFLSKYENA
jgi:ankyrin repeat protein